MKNEQAPQYDYILLVSVFLLICTGLIFVYSASSNLALYRFGDPYMYLKRQAFFCFLGLIVMAIGMSLPLNLFSNKKIAIGLLFLSILALISLFFIGHAVNGARRWIRAFGFSFQPTEMAKFSLCIYMAYSMADKGLEMNSFKKGILHHFIIAGLIMALILKQPDHGSVVMICAWLLIMLFVGGANPFHLFLILLAIVPVGIYLFSHSAYVVHRWEAFRNPWAYADTYGFQIIHSLYAFGVGGIFGVGLGAGKQKLFYLPEPHTDFILPVIGEEIGFIGISIIILLYMIVIAKGIKIAIDTKDLFNKYLTFGISCMLGIQVLINMYVVMNLIPAKGITLPFLSYGGSSLLFSMLEIGILLNVSSKR